VLHGLRVKGLATTAGLDADEAALKALERDGLIRHRDGRAPGWSLTPAGRAAEDELVQAELDGSGGRDAIADGYARFLALNHDFLALCAAWQLDPATAQATVAALASIHEAVGPIVDDLAAALGRFAAYRPRFERALARVEAGDRDWFTRPLIDSYHTVWSELHEDLLSTLGIARGSEVTA
jgi:hypothetical protein